MRFLIVDTYYGPFLQNFYSRSIELLDAPYAKQLRALLDSRFGTSDFYSKNLISLGAEAIDLVVNCIQLQRCWASEYSQDLLSQDLNSAWLYHVFKRQIRHYKPDVLFVHDINWLPDRLLAELKADIPFVVGQNASPIRDDFVASHYDLLLSSIPSYVERFRKQGVASEYFRLGFGRPILECIPAVPSPRYPTVFIGGYSAHHRSGTQRLEAIARQTPVDFWGYGGQALPADSAIRQRYRGEAWALDMYAILSQSKIALNRHIDIAGEYANNMRLYEATGVGTCLLTDAKVNLHQLFEPDREVVTYRSPEECAEKVRYLLDHEDERAAIAKAGQARTLRDHTYDLRMEELFAIINRYWKPRAGTVASAPSSPRAESMQTNSGRKVRRKQTLIFSDSGNASTSVSVAFYLASQLTSLGQAVTFAAPGISSSVREEFQAIDVSIRDWNASQHQPIRHDLKALVQNLDPNVASVAAIFVDASPLSSLSVKDAAADLGLQYSVVVTGAPVSLTAQQNSQRSHVTAAFQRAKSVSATSNAVLATLRSTFGLGPTEGRVLEGVEGAPSQSQTQSPQPKPQQPVAIPNKPHWEYLPQGWATQDPTILGWNVQSILDTQKRKWSGFTRALQGTMPIGMSHESENVSSADYGTHNTMMSFGYVLALAAQGKQKISILDWGSGIGHYYAIAKALLPNVEIEYYGKDLPILCEGGREVLPQVTFYDRDEDCFHRQYDLIVASSSIQYSQNWKEIVSQLARATSGYFYVTRLPIVHNASSFIVVQRPYAYGYHTEYMGWFFNRQEFVNQILLSGVTLRREFLIAEKYPVPNAPEMGEARGFLFQSS